MVQAMWGFKKSAVIAGLMTSLVLTACSPKNEANFNLPDEDGSQNKIIGGSDVGEGATLSKSVVLLINMMTKEICSASLIGGNFAITAAHCVETRDPKNLYIYFGAKPTTKSVHRQVVATKVSPYWEARKNEAKNTSDIAVVKFEGRGIPEGYEAAKFLEDESLLKKGTTAIILGFGINDAKLQTGASVLRYTTLQITNPAYSPTEVLLDQSKGSGACHGDSGGPAFIYAKDKNGVNRFFLWGVANHSSEDDKDNLCDKSVIYTKATLFMTWMELVTKSL